MARCLFAALLLTRFAVLTTAQRPVRFFDERLTPAFPACSASYATPCAFNNVFRLVEDTSAALESDDGADFAEFGAKVDAGDFNRDDGFGFVPYIFDAADMRCVANGRDAAGFWNLTMEEIAASLGITTVQDGLSDEILSASLEANDGWFRFTFASDDYPGEPVPFIGYTKRVDAFGRTFVIVSSLARRLLPRSDIDACPTTVNRRCNIQNVRSLVGAALYAVMAAETPAELREVYNEITFPRDNTFRDGSWYIFVFGFGADFTHGCFSHIRSDWIRQTLFEISGSIVDVSVQNGTVLHEQFREAAIGGGGWAKYDWRISESIPAQVKVSYVTGVERFGDKYYLGAGFNHIRDPAAQGALCSTCSADYSEPCAIGNVLSLSAHAEVELLTRIESSDLFTDINDVDVDDFVMPGGFGVLVVDYESETVMADTIGPARIGGNVAAALAARDIADASTAHAALKSLADRGGGWLALPGVEGSAGTAVFVNKISKDGKEYYLLNGYKHERAPIVEACSSKYSSPCSETNARALIGDLATQIQVAASPEAIDILLSQVNNGSIFAAPDFYPIVLDADFNLLAHGDVATRQGWDVSDMRSYTEFVQQVEAVSTLGNSFETNLRVAAFQVGGGSFKVTWNNAYGVLVDKIIVTQAAKYTSNVDGSVSTYYLLTMYADVAAPTLCSEGCPSNAYCIRDDDGLPDRCECGFYYEAVFTDVNNGSAPCATTLTTEIAMTCEPDSEKTRVNSVKSIARVLGSINCIFAAVCVAWTVVMRKNIIVKASQPALLGLVALGTVVSSMTIFFMAIDDKEGPPAGNGANDIANLACMAQPWFYGLGFAITFCSMIVKLQRVVKVFKSAANMKKSRGVSLRMTLVYLMGLLSVELIFLAVWTVTDPLKFVRPEENPLNGACESQTSRTFITLIAAYHLMLLFYGAYLSYKCRKMNGVFAETKYLSLAMLGNLQVLLLALPVIVLTADDAETSMFIRAIAVFLNDFSTTALIFGPKMYFAAFGPPEDSGAGGNVLSKASNPSRKSKGDGRVSSVVGSTKVVTGTTVNNSVAPSASR